MEGFVLFIQRDSGKFVFPADLLGCPPACNHKVEGKQTSPVSLQSFTTGNLLMFCSSASSEHQIQNRTLSADWHQPPKTALVPDKAAGVKQLRNG